MELTELNGQLRAGKSKALTVLNSMTIQNAPPEKLIDLRNSFDEKLDKLQEILSVSN